MLLDLIHSAGSAEAIRSIRFGVPALSLALALALFNVHLLGRAQVWTDVAESSTPRGIQAQVAGKVVVSGAFEPLSFDEAIHFFRNKTNLSPAQFAALSDAAKNKAFAVAAGATEQITLSIRDILDRALAEGMTLQEFQRQAESVLDRAGVSVRSPWYWETVYRTNLQTSYQAGRWKQMTDPYVKERRPYVRYVSARLPTSRPSHVARHGVVKSVDDPWWDENMPPNGFNCYCSAQSVSESLLKRNGWEVSDRTDFAPPDDGFAGNPGRTEDI